MQIWSFVLYVVDVCLCRICIFHLSLGLSCAFVCDKIRRGRRPPCRGYKHNSSGDTGRSSNLQTDVSIQPSFLFFFLSSVRFASVDASLANVFYQTELIHYFSAYPQCWKDIKANRNYQTLPHRDKYSFRLNLRIPARVLTA